MSDYKKIKSFNIKNENGFTLLELLAIILIIGILGILLWVNTNSSRQSARDQRRLSDASTLSSALELYKQNNHQYPKTLAPGSPLQDALQTYMSAMPHDPSFAGNTTTDYFYKPTDCGLGYDLYFSLEGAKNNLQPGLAVETQGGDISNCTGDCQTGEFAPWQNKAFCQTNHYACGSDNCGGSCGDCGSNLTCDSGFCVSECPVSICGDCSKVDCGKPCTTTVSRDGNSVQETYGSTQINGQCWLTKNVNVGLMKPYILSPADPMDTLDAASSLSRYCLNNLANNCDNGYGGLYTWAMAMYLPASYNNNVLGSDGYVGLGVNARRQGLCPRGYHIPSDREWAILENSVDQAVGQPIGDGETCSSDNWGYNADFACDQTSNVYDSGSTFYPTPQHHLSYGLNAGQNIFSQLNFYPNSWPLPALPFQCFKGSCEFLMSSSQNLETPNYQICGDGSRDGTNGCDCNKVKCTTVLYTISPSFWGHYIYSYNTAPFRELINKNGIPGGQSIINGYMSVRCIKDN